MTMGANGGMMMGGNAPAPATAGHRGMNVQMARMMRQHHCTLGLLSRSGTLYLLVAKPNSLVAASCGNVGHQGTVSGSVLTHGGLWTITVTSMHLQ